MDEYDDDYVLHNGETVAEHRVRYREWCREQYPAILALADHDEKLLSQAKDCGIWLEVCEELGLDRELTARIIAHHVNAGSEFWIDRGVTGLWMTALNMAHDTYGTTLPAEVGRFLVELTASEVGEPGNLELADHMVTRHLLNRSRE